MGLYDNYDKDMAQKAGMIWSIFLLALAFAFIVLKIMAILTWSWLWVLAPIWGPMALGLILTIFGFKPPQ